MLRPIFASRETNEKMKLLHKERIDIYSFFPIDKGDCACASMIKEWKDKLLLMDATKREAELDKVGPLHCPRDTTGMTKYTLTCKNCNEVQGECYATDLSLSDFCDFHYMNWTDGEQWYGCLTPNISPIDQRLTLECMCGYDTRDFRANQTLSAARVEEIETENAHGRDYNQPDSKFLVEVKRA